MDSFGDFVGLVTAMSMIWLGAVVARAAWRELAEQRPAPAPEPPPGDVWLPLLSD